MTYKSLNVSLALRLLIFGLLAALLPIIISRFHVMYSIPVIILMVIVFINFLVVINTSNKKLTFFFDAIRNEDQTLHFPEDIKDPYTRDLHKSLNRVNALISEIKIINARNERFFFEIMKNSASGIVAMDENGFIEFYNKAFLKYTGLVNIAHVNLLKQKNPPVFDAFENLNTGQSKTIKSIEGGELRHLTIKRSNLKFGDKKFNIYTMVDIRPELEENELDSWQKLIRILTHEIMNSIAPITSLSNTLTRFLTEEGNGKGNIKLSLESVNNLKEGLTVIKERSKGLQEFIQNYRKLTKIPKPVFAKVQLDKWLKNIHILMESNFADAQIHFKLNKKTRSKEIIGDVKLLDQVVINILNNAIYALRNKKDKEIVMDVNDSENGQMCMVITDNGEGIKAEDMDKIFIPFFTSKEHGSGIGLSLCRQIIRLHKGSISVKSEPGKTSFSIRI